MRTRVYLHTSKYNRTHFKQCIATYKSLGVEQTNQWRASVLKLHKQLVAYSIITYRHHYTFKIEEPAI
ncbi:hypothetical protein PCA10_19850 [Metapseudomonas resinovorans NBRC 106553]|uniref:Uncharacterized protein n=1 Tax=Metapseudomonas resinovorans NBRC 106553 TaxID=1245471 RepID=S6ADZ7_METRE|nr:hypothetical protein PCA10_19850 [Pseudomonas resinovorans NBRC 106553]